MAHRDDAPMIPLSLIGEYPDSWESSTLGHACELVTDGTHDSPKESLSGFPLVTGRCITGGRVNLDAAYLISESDHREVIARSKPEYGDILFANIGNSIGELARVETNVEFSIKNVALFKPGPRLNSQFLKYYLLSSPVQSFIRGNTFGSAQPFISLGTLRAFPIPLPPIQEQRKIASILGSLDDKIELNLCTNKTLESMARALFKSWFVDFDPVKAKMDGREVVGMDDVSAKLFSGDLVESLLGYIPKDWEIRSLDEIADFLNGLALQKFPPGHGPTLPVIKIAQLRKGDSAGADLCNTDLPPDYIIEDGDVLFSWSGSLEVELWCGGSGALNQHLFKVTSSEFPKWFYYLWTHSHLDDFRLIAAGKATTMGHIQRGHLTAAKVLVPPFPLLEAMSRIMSPIIDKIIVNRIQSRTIAILRDSLLTQLLSGRVRVNTNI